MNTPDITCLMLTCGRWKCIGESIHSFNLQTYKNRKLIIIDTHPKDFKFTEPLPDNVKIVKADSRAFKTIGEKTIAALKLVDTPVMCMWEDDDVWLPHHLERLMAARAVYPRTTNRPLRLAVLKHFFSDGGVDGTAVKISLSQNMCWCRYIFEMGVGHWDKAQSEPFDSVFMSLPWETVLLNTQDESPGYIYRWNNGQHHMSGLYGSGSYESVYRKLEDAHLAGDPQNHPVSFMWRHPYVGLCRDALMREKIKAQDYMVEFASGKG